MNDWARSLPASRSDVASLEQMLVDAFIVAT